MKKILLFVVMMFMLSSMVSAEAASPIKLTADGGYITIEAVCGLPQEGKVTMIVIKEGAAPQGERIYGVEEIVAKPGEEMEFKIYIPDKRRISGERGSGRYNIYINNKDGQPLASVSFDYADSAEITEFVKQLKMKADSVTDKDKAYEALSELMTDSNAGVFFAIGIDYEQYKASTEDVRENTLNILYNSGADRLDARTLPEAFRGAFGLATYNSGEREDGIDILKPEYNGVKIDSNDEYAGNILAMMEKSYETAEAFRKEFKTAYGIETVNNANKYTIEEVLDVFSNETDECKSEISKINNLSSSKKTVAYEYIIVSAKNSRITSLKRLEELLNAAYAKATSSVSSSPGDGGGGSSGGGASVSGKGSANTFYPQEDKPVEEKPESPTMIFTDLSDEHWAAESVKWLKERGIVNGTDTGAFEPSRAVTREEFTKMIVSACGFEIIHGETAFEDVASDMWFAPYIITATELGIIKGTDENTFGAGQQITRQDMAVIADRVLKISEIQKQEIRQYAEFADNAEISDYAAEAVANLYIIGVINGKDDNMFDPLGTATRAEAAKIIYEVFS